MHAVEAAWILSCAAHCLKKRMDIGSQADSQINIRPVPDQDCATDTM